MSIVRLSPIKEPEDIRRDMDRLFEEFFAPHRRRLSWRRPLEAEAIVPNIDMFDRKTEIVIRVDIPEAEKDNIELTVTKDTLTIKGSIKQDEIIKSEDYYARERSFGTFARTITLPQEVDSSKAKASYKNGVLEITLPQNEEVKPAEIKVEIGG